jgi:hypothetical protein
METPTPVYEPQPQVTEPKKSNKVGIIIAVVVVVLCCCCVISLGLGYWLWNNGDRLMGTGAFLRNLLVL